MSPEALARPERRDDLGRVIPALAVGDLESRIRAGASSLEVRDILAVTEDRDSYNHLVRVAGECGHTHYPPGLDGRASPLREIP